MSDQVEIADELDELCSYGATPHKIVTMPHLMEALHLPANTPQRILGIKAVKELERQVTQVFGTHYLPGFNQTFTTEQVQGALNMLLGFSRTSKGYKVTRRREEAIKILGLQGVMAETWRRPHGAEFDLMMILAKSLTEHFNSKAVKWVHESYYNHRGLLVRGDDTFTIEVLRDGFNGYIWSGNRVDPRTRYDIKAKLGCEVTEVESSEVGVSELIYVARLKLPELARGDLHTIGITTEVTTLERTPYSQVRAQMPIDHLRVSVFFGRSFLPRNVRAFRMPAGRRQDLEPEPDGSYSAEFYGIAIGQESGIRWDWPS